MGYSLNPDTVEARRHLLGELEAGRTARWVTTKDALVTRRLANQIREALYIAARHPEKYPALAAAAERFSIYVVADGLIEARVKTSMTETSIESTTPTHSGTDDPLHGERVPLVSLTSADQIIAAWKEHLPSSDALHFTSTTLPDSELDQLYVWTRSWTPRLMFLVGDDTLTLSLWDVTVREYAWHPSSAPPEPEEELNL